MEKNEVDFCIEINFSKNSEQPSRVFQTMSNLIESFEKIDENLIGSIHSDLKTVLILEDIESGSIRAWLRNKIENLDDEMLKSGDYKKIVGHYLVKSKYYVIDFLHGKTKISSKEEIDELQNNLLQLAQDTDMLYLPSYAPMSTTQLLKSIDNITTSLSPLSSDDIVTYLTNDEKINFNPEFNYIPEEIEELITKELVTNEITIILKVKKPDYLGESQWEFKHGNSPINAKITDVEWLRNFQQREIDVRPQDSIKAKVKQIICYDYDHNPISTKHEIVKIFQIIRAENNEQGDIFEGND